MEEQVNEILGVSEISTTEEKESISDELISDEKSLKNNCKYHFDSRNYFFFNFTFYSDYHSS